MGSTLGKVAKVGAFGPLGLLASGGKKKKKGAPATPQFTPPPLVTSSLQQAPVSAPIPNFFQGRGGGGPSPYQVMALLGMQQPGGMMQRAPRLGGQQNPLFRATMQQGNGNGG